ncbi:MAG: toll/interleukin-1 receptor domain-containing protein [Pseudomonadota bacterium]
MNAVGLDTEHLWDQVLEFIEEGRVIPVIGPELLMVEINGASTLLYGYLAEQLARRLHLSPEPEDTLSGVTCRYIAQGRDREDIYPELKRVMSELPELDLPAPLEKLAEITPLKLFVTTTFDNLLADALDKVRYGGQAKTQVLAFAPDSGSSESSKDLAGPIDQLDRATVFHLFGRLSAVPDYAVTDEDVLEFMHALQSRTTRPEGLFDALVRQNLVVIGCPLSGWLARFFVRIGKRQRLVMAGGKTDVLVGDLLQRDTSLVYFLRHFSSRTKVFPGGAVAFVDELHRRWMESHPAARASTSTTVDQTDASMDKMQSGAVFLSYASEDRPVVIIIRDALEKAGIDVWFDRNPEALRVGEDFAAKIKANVDQCSLFIPIISHNTLTQRPRFFRTEWNHARQVALRFPDNMRFIIPVAVDDTPPDSAAVPEDFRKLHWERLRGGQTTPEFVDEIKRLYRQYQRALA